MDPRSMVLRHNFPSLLRGESWTPKIIDLPQQLARKSSLLFLLLDGPRLGKPAMRFRHTVKSSPIFALKTVTVDMSHFHLFFIFGTSQSSFTVSLS